MSAAAPRPERLAATGQKIAPEIAGGGAFAIVEHADHNVSRKRIRRRSRLNLYVYALNVETHTAFRQHGGAGGHDTDDPLDYEMTRARPRSRTKHDFVEGMPPLNVPTDAALHADTERPHAAEKF